MTNCLRRLHLANSWYVTVVRQGTPMAAAAAPEKKPAKRRCGKIVTIVIGAFAGGAAEEPSRHITQDTTWFVDRIEAPAAPTATSPRTPAEPPSYDVRFQFFEFLAAAVVLVYPPRLKIERLMHFGRHGLFPHGRIRYLPW